MLKNKKNITLAFTVFTSLSLVSVYSFAQMPGSSPTSNATPAAVTPATQTVYQVQLSSLNDAINGVSTSGVGTVIIDGDHFGVSLQATGLSPGLHEAHIHKGPVCPNFSDDLNGDGVVDVLEGFPKYGGILINYDGDLSSFDAGMSFTPSANTDGSMFYAGGGSLSSILTDLHRPAPPAASGIGTLVAGEQLNLDNAVVVIHGISDQTSLPSTVQTITGDTPNESIPVACGQLVRVEGPQVQAGATPVSTGTPAVASSSQTSSPASQS